MPTLENGEILTATRRSRERRDGFDGQVAARAAELVALWVTSGARDLLPLTPSSAEKILRSLRFLRMK